MDGNRHRPILCIGNRSENGNLLRSFRVFIQLYPLFTVQHFFTGFGNAFVTGIIQFEDIGFCHDFRIGMRDNQSVSVYDKPVSVLPSLTDSAMLDKFDNVMVPPASPIVLPELSLMAYAMTTAAKPVAFEMIGLEMT